MNLAFSTRGWRETDWARQMEDACEMQFNGIEVYNLHRITSLTIEELHFTNIAGMRRSVRFRSAD